MGLKEPSARGHSGWSGSRTWLRLPVYPVLLAAFPVMNLAAHNAAELPLSDWVGPLLIAMGLSLILLVMIAIGLRDPAKAGMVTAVLVITFGYYGHIVEVLPPLALAVPVVAADARFFITFELIRLSPPFFVWVGDSAVAFDRVFVPLWMCGSAIAIVAGLRLRRNLAGRIPVLNATGLFLVALPGLALGRHAMVSDTGDERWEPSGVVSITPDEPARDIYYLIFDRYGSDPILKEFFDFDNGNFRAELEARGFYVTGASYANYPQTMHSLASSLNFEYLDEMGAEMRASGSLSPLVDRMENHRVGAMLQAAGYRYDHAGAWWVHTRHNRNADQLFTAFLATEFGGLLLDRTLLIRSVSAFGGESAAAERLLTTLRYSRLARWRFLNAKFEWIAGLPGGSRPAFVFGHFLLPHNPYTMDRNGNFVTRSEELQRSRHDNYLGQVEAANQKILRLVDRILERSEVPPIIIIQADEGPYPERFYAHQGGATEWKTATADELRMKLGILNALYLPERDSLPLHDGISPVNTFRIIFDAYFDTRYGLLPDRSFIFSGNFHKFWDVTDELRGGVSVRGARSD